MTRCDRAWARWCDAGNDELPLDRLGRLAGAEIVISARCADLDVAGALRIGR
jgi:hypothetical protein